jgi:nitrous oxidase accessory protein
MTRRTCLLVLAGALTGTLAAESAAAAELHVGPGGYSTVSAAIQAASPGDVIRIAAGTYRESIVLSKPLTLIGEGMPRLDGGRSGDVIRVTAPDCRISGLHVTGSGREALTDSAAIKLTAPGAVIEENLLDESLFGIYLNSVRNAVIRDNEIRGIAELPAGDRGDGIHLFDSPHNRIENNRIAVTRDGIYFNASPFNTLTGNTVSQARYGLHYMYSDDNVFSGNRFTETEAGSAVMFSRRLTLRDNLFSGNRGFRAYGLLIKDCEETLVEGNAVLGNRVGIFMDGAIGLTVARNRIVGNDLGIEVRGSSEGNDFLGNTIAGNATSAALPTGRSENRWDGNYWSDYRGYDLDGNGRGDVTHAAGSVFAYLTENMPPARLFLLSPAIQALEFAERTFPIVNVPGVEDDAPSMKPTVEGEARPLASRGIDLPMLGISLGALILGILPLVLVRKAFSA